MFFLWIWIVIRVFSDIFASRDLSGWGKALWSLFVVFLPVLGVTAYLIVRGPQIGGDHFGDAQRIDPMMRTYTPSTAPAPNPAAADLGTLSNLRSRGVIDEAEYESLKSRLNA
jgi:hypothetical protein